MASNEMNLKDILKYAAKIEHESNLFYANAVESVSDSAVKELLVDLKEEEIKHEKRLTAILSLTTNQLEKTFSELELHKLITTHEIPKEPTKKQVLEVALEREEQTRDFYAKIATLTDIDASIVEVFEMLYKQESYHCTRVSSMLDSL